MSFQRLSRKHVRRPGCSHTYPVITSRSAAARMLAGINANINITFGGAEAARVSRWMSALVDDIDNGEVTPADSGNVDRSYDG
ncbi:hypothetical protein [Paraburkholderia sediminicola]|uniref:hypothetical protein n=1 Tax=Paraburkholderia sediminicola TaxID=458836 RepID=UPI0038BCE1C5